MTTVDVATRADDAALFEYARGLHLRQTVLWIDAPQGREVCFVSSAAVPGAHAHDKVLCTKETADLLRAIAATHGRGRRAHLPRALVTPYGRPFALGRLTLELFPSGFVLGSASLLIEHEGRKIVYAGPINLRERAPVERLEARRCDVLVLSGGYAGSRRVVLPPADQVVGQIVRFVDATLADGHTPVLLTSVLGEAQELVALLGERKVRLHRRIHAATRVYAAHGAEGIAGRRVPCYRDAVRPGETLIWPARLWRSRALERVPSPRTALVSALAQQPPAAPGKEGGAGEDVHEIAPDAAFAYSARADYGGLLEYVRACSPRTVVLTGGYSAELSADLEALGVAVVQAGPSEQLELF